MTREERYARDLKEKWVQENIDDSIGGYIFIFGASIIIAGLSIFLNNDIDGLYHKLFQLPFGLSSLINLVFFSVFGIGLSYFLGLSHFSQSPASANMSRRKKLCLAIAVLPLFTSTGIAIGGIAHFAILIPMALLTALASPQPYLKFAMDHPIVVAIVVAIVIIAFTSTCIISYFRACKEHEFEEMARKAKEEVAAAKAAEAALESEPRDGAALSDEKKTDTPDLDLDKK